MNDIYPIDIWHVIFRHCDLLSQLTLITSCSDFYRSFFITDLCNIPNIYQNKLTDLVLQQRKFSRLVKLDIRHNKNINDISFLTTLKKLYVNHLCGIDQQGIYRLDLIELYADSNEKIKDVSFMTSLKKLYAGVFCGINQQGIQGLNLIELYAANNEKINDVFASPKGLAQSPVGSHLCQASKYYMQAVFVELINKVLED